MHRLILLTLFACSGPHEDGDVNFAPPPEDKTAFTYIQPGGFKINYNRERVAADKVTFEDTDLVLGVLLDGEARAYPINLMAGPSNEIVNDHLGKSNILITWCSFDYSGAVYDREHDGRPLHFGVMGLDHGRMLLYDRETGSRWSQVGGKAIDGEMKDERLVPVPSALTTWKQWVTRHPGTTVYINRKVPYQPQFTGASIRELAARENGPGLQPTDLLLALEGQTARAYPFKHLVKTPVINDTFEETPILVVLSNNLITARVYDRRIDGQTLTFEKSWFGNKLVDAETGTEWDVVTGSAIAGSLAGKSLQPLHTTYVLWYAWKGYRPDTAIHDGS